MSATSGLKVHYSPSWYDRLMAWVGRFPLPIWLFYFLFLFAQGAAHHLIAWQTGTLKLYETNLLMGLSGIWNVEILLFSHFLNSVGRDMLKDYRALLPDLREEDYEQMGEQFRMTPPRPTLNYGLLGFVLGLLLAYATQGIFPELYGFPPFTYLQWAFTVALIFAFGYRVQHQLRFVSNVCTITSKVDIFYMEPIYGLSRMALWTALSIVVITDFNILLVPELLNSALYALFFVTITLLSLVAFLWPTRKINRRIVEEKARQLEHVSKEIEESYERLSKQRESGELKDMYLLKSLLDALHSKREYIQNTAHWPWRPGSFTGLLSAILLPVLLRFLIIGLDRMIGL